MAGAKAEAGNIGQDVTVGIPGVQAKAEAGTVALSARTTIAVGAAVGVATAVAVGMQVTRAPFSPIGIAEHLATDPEFYRRMATFIAGELAWEAAKYSGQGNADQVIKNELNNLQHGFTEIAKQIGTKAYDVAANIVIGLRDSVVAFHDNYPDLLETIGKLGAISLSTWYLGTLGVPVTMGVLVSAAIVNHEKIADLIKAWKAK